MESLEILNGILTTIVVSISILVGVKIALKYRLNRMKAFLYFGCTWILIVQHYYPAIFAFYLNLLTGLTIDLRTYLMFNLFAPLCVMFGVLSATELVFQTHRKFIIRFYYICAILLEILLVALLILDPSLVAELSGTIDIEYNLVTKLFILFVLPTIFVMGIVFTRESFKSEDPIIRRKGKFLFFAFCLFAIGTLLETMIPNNNSDLFLLLLTKSILILSSIAFYFGFLLPKFLQKKYNLEEKEIE